MLKTGEAKKKAQEKIVLEFLARTGKMLKTGEAKKKAQEKVARDFLSGFTQPY